MKAIDIEQLLSEERWNGYAKRLVLGTSLTLFLAGLDNLLLSITSSAMRSEWRWSSAADLGFVLSVELLGIIFGGLLGGLLGDRLGRRFTLKISVFLFAGMTLAISAAGGTAMLTVLRFIFGVGYGAALPNAAVLAYEYVPKRNKLLAVTLTMLALPLSGFFAPSLSIWVLRDYGWRAAYIWCGVISIVLAVILFKELPESPQFLAGNRQRWPELIALLRRLGISLPADSTFGESGSPDKIISKARIRDLFAPALLLRTIGVFGTLFLCVQANYTEIKLLLPVLTRSGFTMSDATRALVNWNQAGIIGSLVGVILIRRFGLRITILGMSVASVVCATILTSMRIDPGSPMKHMIALALLGALVNAVQMALYFFAADVYSPGIRATGVGTAIAISRIANVSAPMIGGYAFDTGAAPSYFLWLAIAVALTMVFFAVFRRHLEGSNSVVSEK